MRLLIIGSLTGELGSACNIAIARGAKVMQADTIETGLDIIRSAHGAELVMIDVALDVARLIESLKSEHIVIPVVACGMGSDTRAAVAAIKAGAKEYIPLPPDADLIAAVLEAVAAESHDIIFQDPKMRDLLRLADQVAPSEANILVSGESGTGKELVARYIHRKSRRADKPFVSLNCAAIPDNLLESELFGHEKGAFTGAVARRIGKFEAADGGTLLLDEISEMDIRLQAKLLRAIQEREIDRVGGSRPVKVDIRVVATTNRDLSAEIAHGRFREDLYFRLNVVNLRLPPLRERPGDTLPLAEHFITHYAEANGVPRRPLSEAARRHILDHQWRGNVRELENTMHRAVLLASGDEIGPEAIMLVDETGAPTMVANAPAEARGGGQDKQGDGLVGRTVAEVERDLIINTLEHCLGNRTHAANILGISIRTLRNKLKQYSEEGVPVPEPGEASRAAG